MFERRREPLISRRRFAYRLAASLAIAFAIDAIVLAIGTVGYHRLAGIGWLDASVDAVMVITGNGLVTRPATAAGKLFSIADALFGVMAFIIVTGVVLAPVFHRLLHSFHLEVRDEST
jgi:hypothetical protein